ncbi:MAG TPA: S28 family serine protease [Kofleriaceae bacterium]|nr:S28 family serine protease [Kofleriaceae bacterium]
MSARVPWALAVALALAAACGDDDGGGGDPGGAADARPTEPDAAGDPDAEPGFVCERSDDDLLVRLEAIPSVASVVEEDIGEPYRFFRIEFEQPVDHASPGGATFRQRITLLHRDLEAPMVLHTTGYYGVGGPFAAEPTALLDANQIDTEQRFFLPSRPDPADWRLLTIEQAAADHHRIVAALRPIYCAKWVSTGASKGGMTSVYHRRFYPNDVDATVAYVAPISFGAPDDRYHPFFDTVATAGCRTALRSFQTELLERRAAMLTRMQNYAEQSGITFDRLSGTEGAFEDAIIEFPWGFWQYGSPSDCASIPPTTATDAALFSFLRDSGGLYFFGDDTIVTYSPYYYQAWTQLGYPSAPTAHIADLLETQALPRDYMPDGVEPTYQPAAMQDVDQWVRGEAERILFVYGEFDPWYAGHFELGDAEDSLLLVAPGANHGAGISDLEAADRETATAALRRWMGVAALAPAAQRAASALPGPPPPPRLRLGR